MDYSLSVFVIALFVITYCECHLVKSRLSSFWPEAQSQCDLFGGHLATLDDLDLFKNWLATKEADYVLEDGSELWVGAKLERGSWKWGGDSGQDFNGSVHYYESKGCHQQQFWRGGTRLDNLTPQLCLEQCNWKGNVGLKKDYCLCEHDLQNVTTTTDNVCHIQCDGDGNAMCGGYWGVSIYGQADFSIGWANNEPKEDSHCAVLRKKTKDSNPELVAADCDMQTRYLCTLEEDIACGRRSKCIRSSVTSRTWSGARKECNVTSLPGAILEEAEDLKDLAPGLYWVQLRQESAWYWTTGKPVNMTQFFPYATGLESGLQHVCAVVQNYRGEIGFVARSCSDRRYYLCKYDYMKSMLADGPAVEEDEATTIGPVPNVTVKANTTKTRVADERGFSVLGANGLYMFLGFLCGMVCILVIGLVVYGFIRCSQPDPSKHSRLQDKPGRTSDNHSVNSKDDSLRISPPHSDITYDTVYDQGDNPFRRSQRIIQTGSANSWRHGPSRRVRSDTSDSSNSDYTWRGMIGGKMEVVNTELRHQYPNQSNGISTLLSDSSDRSLRSERAPRTIKTRCDVHSDIPLQPLHSLDGIYQLPVDTKLRTDESDPYFQSTEPDSLYPRRGNSDQRRQAVNRGYVSQSLPRKAVSPVQGTRRATIERASGLPIDPEVEFPESRDQQSFLELRAARNSESNEENIYATIKKTFQKIKDDMAAEARKSGNDEDNVMYSIRLTDL